MPKVTEEKKQVLVRVPMRLYKELLGITSSETLRRGEPVTVPGLINEQIERWLQDKKGDEGGESNIGS